MSTLAALFWLTRSLLTRLLRYGMIVRSLAFPATLIALTLLLTVWVVQGTQPAPIMAVTSEFSSSQLDHELKRVGLSMQVVDDPMQWVQSGRATAGTDGATYWVSSTSRLTLAGEHAVRTVLAANWRPAIPELAPPEQIQALGTLIARVLLGIFSLYGVVFGAAMVARDREDGSLEVDCALPIPRWVHGTARVSAGSALLIVFLTSSLYMLQALVGVMNANQWLIHGTAASLASVALGLVSAGRAKLNTGFGAALALGLTLATALFGIGYGAPIVGQHLPLASIVTGGDPLVPLLSSSVLTLFAIAWFTRFGLRVA